jgi:transcriptional regulator with XRE-family HTH domain
MGRRSGEPTIIGANLKRLRGQRSQRDLADLTNGAVGQADISRIENGETPDPGASKLHALATALGVSILEFWDGEQPAVGYEAGLQEFLDSPLGTDVTPEEKAELRKAAWPWGPPTIKGWYHALETMRATRRNP